MQFEKRERTILRNLANKIADIAVKPIMEPRRQLWRQHNSLKSTYPMMLLFPEGSWQELLPESVLLCRGPEAREIEWNLRHRIYTHEHFQDDTVIEAEWVVPAVIHSTGWGLESQLKRTEEFRGGYCIEPVLKNREDLKKMHFPELTYDEGATQHKVAQMQDLLGDILDVKFKGRAHISFHLTYQYIFVRGTNELFMDMATEPEFVHEFMNFLMEGNLHEFKQWEDFNLLSLNNDNTYNTTGGNGYTDELPKPGFDANRVRPEDLWASAEAQELAGVSPEMHNEFALKYEKQLLERFGLTGYGCCEDLTHKLDYVFTIPNIRRISCSPWADVPKCAEKLKGNYIFSWKPNPAHLVGAFNPGLVRKYIRGAVEVARAHGCVFEMILKDTHTCENQPNRFDDWAQIGREVIQDVAGLPK
jgi:hypothetical protein